MIPRDSLYAVIATLVILGVACSSDNESTLNKTGGRSGVTGGTSSTGGKIGLGGATGMGGTSDAGSTDGQGGVVAMGGESSTGGAMGGSVQTGGNSDVDGYDVPVSSNDGQIGLEDASQMPGETGGIDAASDDAGQGDVISAEFDGGTTTGCNSAVVASPCAKSGAMCSVPVNGTPRTFYVQLPAGYVSSKMYPVVFQFHPLGGSAEQAMAMYNMKLYLPDAIYVTPQGLKANSGTGWANTDGQDIAFTKAMVADIQGQYCVDPARIFAMGYDYGGMMTFAIGCEVGDVFRAIAPMAGALYSAPSCYGTGHAIAMWGYHGQRDMNIPVGDGRTARNRILKQNHCGTQTTPTEPSDCVSYQGCDTGYPVVWCEDDGYHGMPLFGNRTIAAFFKQF